MTARALLAITLGLGLGPSGAALAASTEVEMVRAVEVEAEQPERLRPLIDLEPGRPFDPEAVRRAVERLFASGRFEDVTVHLARDSGPGVTVVFRPLPAPLLMAVRVQGDRVLSPRAVARVARLRAGEPLWPSRLDRAGRDLALALVRRGYVEAFVEPPRPVRVPGGADAVFRIHAGPRVRVGRLSVVSARQAPKGLDLEALARPRRGEIYRGEQADAAADEIVDKLVRAGHWRATAHKSPTYDPGRGIMDLVFEVDPGPELTLEVRGCSPPRELLRGLEQSLKDGRASSDALEAARERIEAHLRRLGHRDAVVHVGSERRERDEVVVFDAQPGPRALVAALALHGAEAALLEGLRTRSGQPLEDAALDQDQATLVARLLASGHFEARVEAEVAEGGGNLDVAFVARPGPRAEVLELEVVAPPLPMEALADAAAPELPLHAGAAYRLAEVTRSQEVLVAAWRRAGYLDARVRPEAEWSADREQVRLRLVVEPGARTLVARVVMAGLRHTEPVVVERETLLRPGEPFSFERLLESQRRLSSLGIFERVSISELSSDSQRRDLVVSVEEAPRTTVAWGLGYSRRDQTPPGSGGRSDLRGSVELTRRNLGGLGRSAAFFARGSLRGSRVLANLREPWLFGHRLDLLATASWEEEDRGSFSYNRKTASLQAARSLDRRTSLILRYLLQDVALFHVERPLDEIDRQYRTYTLAGPAASVLFDSRDDALEPRRGLFLGADLQLSLAALGGESFVRSYLQATGVRELRSNLVFVLSGRLGLAEAFEREARDLPEGLARDLRQLPLPERFFAGGDFGPRGFAIDGVGPWALSSQGKRVALGGNALLLGGAELRYNLTRSFQLASFFDVGNVYGLLGEVDLGDLRRSTGLGLRYRTPVGPVRLDWGFVLDPRPGERERSSLHLTIGHAF